jgi:hypothetical protein
METAMSESRPAERVAYMIQRLLMWEIPLMGWGFAWRRMVASLPLPFLCGLLAAAMWYANRNTPKGS